MQRNLLSFVLGMLAFVALAVPAATRAADPSPGSLSEMWVLTPKEGQAAELMQGIKAQFAMRKDEGDPWTWQVFTPVLGDSLSRIVVRTCCFEWEDLDSYEAWNKEHPALQQQYFEEMVPHMRTAGHYLEEMDWADSHWNPQAGPFRFFAVTEWVLKPGHEAVFNEARSKASQIAINQGWGGGQRSWLWGSRIGGTPRAFLVVPYRNYADMQRKGDSFLQFLAEQMGSQEAAKALMQDLSGSTTGSDFQIWELRELEN